MPLTKKGNKILAAMAHEYGARKGKRVFYASKNKGSITGVDRERTCRVSRKSGIVHKG